MQQLQFPALGTEWTILIDEVEGALKLTKAQLSQLQADIIQETNKFDQECSRFIETSVACSFRNKQSGTFSVTGRFAELLKTAQALKEKTNGAYDPAVGGLLELAGYDQKYGFQVQKEKIKAFELPKWSISDDRVTISSGIVFDIGGIGKGYWVDQIALMLRERDLHYFLIDGGGDMCGTTKADKSGWNVALEWPGDEKRVVGTVLLQDQGLAVSDIFKRRWDEWHHLVSLQMNQPAQEIVWCAAVADTAWFADQSTAALTLDWPQATDVANELGAAYLACTLDKKLHQSQDWVGELF